MIGWFGIALGLFLLLSSFSLFTLGREWLYSERLMLARLGGLAMLILGLIELMLPAGRVLLALRIIIGGLYLAMTWLVRYELLQTGMFVAGVLILIRAVLIYFNFDIGF